MKKLNYVITKKISQEWLNKVELTLNGFKYDEDKGLVKLACVITKDANNYEDASTTNLYEKLTIKAENLTREDTSKLRIGQKVRLEKVSNVITYGEYQNEISITASVKVANE